MTGFEHTVAAHLFTLGEDEAALQIVSDIRERYDGRKRNPFDEAECGHHYARAMASWTSILALTGFHYSGITQSLCFAAAPRDKSETKWFWSNGAAWGTITQKPLANGTQVDLRVEGGSLQVRTIELERRQANSTAGSASSVQRRKFDRHKISCSLNCV